MRESLDACPEFDDLLLERAFQASPDASLDRHLATCARCRTARDRYAATAAVLEDALAEPEPVVAPSRKRSVGIGWILAAAAVVILAAVWWTVRHSTIPSGLRWSEGANAIVERLGSDRLRLDRGSATFVAPPSIVVETSIGEVRAASAEFTVTMAEPNEAKVEVARGSVRWVDAQGEVVVEKGTSLSRGGSTPPASELEADRTTIARSPSEEIRTSAAGGFEIFGKVVDAETGESVAGAEVVLCARKETQTPQAARVRTEADGSFRAHSAAADEALFARSPFAEAMFTPSAEAWLTIQAEGYAPISKLPPDRFREESPLDVGHPIELGKLEIFRGARVSGRVVMAESGQPVTDARILLAVSPRTWGGFVGEGAREVARSGANGSFVIDRRVGPCAQDQKHCLLAVSPLGVGWKELDVLATQREVSDVEIAIEPTAPLDVLVLGDGPTHAPIQGVTVSVEPKFAPLLDGGRGPYGESTFGIIPDDGLRSCFQQTTDGSGRARFEHIPARPSGERYDVFARMKGYVRGFEPSVDLRRTEVHMTLHADWTWSVEGTVKSEEGVPVAGATVEAVVGGRPRTTTDASGAYRFENLEHGAAGGGLIVSAPGFVAQQQAVHVSRKDAGVPCRADLVLKRARPIAGRIVDEHGAPVAGASVWLHQGHDELSLPSEGSKTGADGAFRFDEATSGEWELRIAAPEPQTDWRRPWTQQKLAGGDTEVRVVLERDERTRSRLVVDFVDVDTGAPVDPTAVAVLPNAPATYESWATPTVVRRPGGATIEPLHPNDWRIWVRVGRTITSQLVRIEEGEAEVRATVPVGRPGVITGSVECEGADAAEQVCVLFECGNGFRPGDSDHDEWSGGSLLTAFRPIEPDGTFRLEDVSPGRWTLTVRQGGWLGSAEVEVPSGGEGKVVIHSARVGRLVFKSPPSPGDVIEYSIAEGDQADWRIAMRMGGMKGREYVEEQTVRPGRVRWKVKFQTENRGDASDAALPQEGELQVAAGDVIDIPVPVVPKH
jgi:hypothetical protein